MYLKSLEIFGFKSFPEKTILKFEPGITAIVGPNGCGKSNIFDATKWALGEQSPKSLRGSKMEDVIFNGTENHPPLNYTEITLIFSNEDSYLPIDYKEVAITRKLYRSGESEYYLNKNLVRLKDIQDLFLGTGIGEATYSFIEQGKIEIFLSYKPEEKRIIFDEASGIVKYKERKKETLKKLRDTEQNLLRLEDIITEVRRQIRHLERQVEKAKKYKEIESSLITIEKKIANMKLKDLETKTNLHLEELSRFKKEEESKDLEVTRLRDEHLSHKNKLQDIRSALDNIVSQIASLESQKAIHRNNIDANLQRIDEREARVTSINDELGELQSRLSSQYQRLEAEKELATSLDKDIERLNKEIDELQNNKELIKKELVTLHAIVDRDKKEILGKELEKTQVNNECVEVQAYLKNLYARRKRLLLDREKLTSFLQEKEDAISKVSQELGLLEKDFSQLKEEKGRLGHEVLKKQDAKQRLQKHRIGIEKQLVELNSYYEFLKDLRVKYGSFSSTKKVKVIFDEPLSRVNKLIASLKDVNFSEEIDGEKTYYAAEVEAKVILFEEDELQNKINYLKEEIEKIDKSLENEEEKERNLQDEWANINKRILEFDKNLREKLHEKENLSQALLRIKEEWDLLEIEKAENAKNIEEAENQKKHLEEAINNIESNLGELKRSLEGSQQRIASLQETMRSIEIEITKKETEKTSLEQNKGQISQRIYMYDKDTEMIRKNMERLGKEKEESLEKISSLKKEIEILEERITQDSSQIGNLTKDKEELRQQERLIEKDMGELSLKITELDEDLQKIRASIYEKKLKLQELEFEKNKIIDYLRQVYHIEFEPEDPGEISLANLEEEREKVKKRLDLLGEVNLVAIDEFEELNKRYQFLEEQREDLIKSKEELKRAIQKINKISREIFLEAFSKIREEFKKNFRFLFGGGRAELVLLDEDNVLESGVEIEVQPPGKKLQNVSLLSGGEKALTAIGLIFAIFKIRPSPLCMLDEIDAPLDEANVDRFNQLLKEFAQNSQFILITHNKRTMGSADVLYGVTMQEKGVSKIVSVKFAQESLR